MNSCEKLRCVGLLTRGGSHCTEGPDILTSGARPRLGMSLKFCETEAHSKKDKISAEKEAYKGGREIERVAEIERERERKK